MIDKAVGALVEALNNIVFNDSNTVDEALEFAAVQLEETMNSVLNHLSLQNGTDSSSKASLKTMWNEIQALVDDLSLRGGKVLEEGTFVQGTSPGGTVTLTSIQSSSNAPIYWPFPTSSNELCTDSDDRNNPTHHCYVDEKQEKFAIPPLSSLGLVNSSAVAVSFTIYNKTELEGLFDELDDSSRIGSQVVSVTVDGVPHGTDFSSNEKFELTLQVNDKELFELGACAFWNISKKGWDTSGCTTGDVTDEYFHCECSHFTSFAILLDTGSGSISEGEAETLSIFVYVCVAVSIFCLTFVLVIYCVFHNLRTPAKNILLHLAAVYNASLILFILAGEGEFTGDSCKAVGVLLHFALFATFMWMLIEGHHLYDTFVNIFGSQRRDHDRQLKIYMALAYGIPLLEVILAVSIWPEAYERDDEVCFLAKKNDAIWLLAGPVLAIIVVNIIILIIVSRVILSIPSSSSKGNSQMAQMLDKAKRGFKSTVMFGSIMGLTWLLGYLSLFWSDEIVFHYFFAIFNALGGLWILLFHVVWDPEVRKRARQSVSSSFSSGSAKKGGVIRRANGSNWVSNPTASMGFSPNRSESSVESVQHTSP